MARCASASASVAFSVTARAAECHIALRNGSSSRGNTPRILVSASAHEECTFARRDEAWTIAYGGNFSSLRDGKGLRYLATLLRHPGRMFHCMELVAIASDAALGDDDGHLQCARITEYRCRLADLRDDLDEAVRWNDAGRMARARAATELLLEEAVRTVRGQTGRPAERARLAVTKGIRTALARIRTVNPELGYHLAVTVKRGYRCAYRPDPRRSIVWRG